MRKVLKGLGIAVLVLAVIAGAVYAYTAITVTSEVEVLEPISIVSVEGDGTFAGNVWDIGVIYPLGEATITITFANEADGPITLELTANPASLDDGNLIFDFDDETLQVPAGGTASVTLSASTTASLAPGDYSTEITVER